MEPMFTGLVQAVGRVERRGRGLLVEGCAPFAPLQLGDSVAVDGVCLTVASLVGDGFLADVSEETLQRTSLGRKASRGGAVNLEPALRLSDRLGGHLVSGHVDGTGEVVSIEALPQSWTVELRWNNAHFARYICDKASVAVDAPLIGPTRNTSPSARVTLRSAPTFSCSPPTRRTLMEASPPANAARTSPERTRSVGPR